ncbi:MAG: helix-hairpin-helix domain-containing protein [Planctomycetia bacterium]|nr:helix-hairpin-helix domain-containing protein [Planctomycetia bacterium]
MRENHGQENSEGIASRIWLKRAEQATTAALVVAALALMALYWWRQGGWQGRMIDVERLPSRSATFQVDVNTAPWTELSQVPEIGETLAQRIVEYRTQHGPFRSPAELSNVPGIGPRTLERMLPALQPFAAAEKERASP